MGKVIRLSATEARNNFFSLLNRVLYTDITVIVDKIDAPAKAEIRRIDEGAEKKKRVKEALKALEELRFLYKNVPEKVFKERDKLLRGKKEKEYMKKLIAGKYDET